MATVLPAINSASNKSGVLKHHAGPKSTGTQSQIHVIQISKGYKGKKELEYEQRKHKLREQQPLLSEREASQ